MPATNPPKQVSSSSSSICLTMTAVGACAVLVIPDDLVRIIEAEGLSGAGEGQRVVEGVEDINWQDLYSSVIFPSAR
jgi:hypothetical protein